MIIKVICCYCVRLFSFRFVRVCRVCRCLFKRRLPCEDGRWVKSATPAAVERQGAALHSFGWSSFLPFIPAEGQLRSTGMVVGGRKFNVISFSLMLLLLLSKKICEVEN